MSAPDPTPRTELGEGIAAILRVGTILAVLVIGVGFLVASMTGLPSRGARPLTDYVTRTGPDTPIAIGLVGLTLLPLIVLIHAARSFARSGERDRFGTTLVVIALLAASLLISVLVAPAI